MLNICLEPCLEEYPDYDGWNIWGTGWKFNSMSVWFVVIVWNSQYSSNVDEKIQLRTTSNEGCGVRTEWRSHCEEDGHLYGVQTKL